MGTGFRESALVVLLVWASLSATAQVEWLPLKLEGARESIGYLPGSIQQRGDTVTTPLGRMPFETYYHQDDEANSGNRLYMVTVIRYGDGSFPADSTARVTEFFEATAAAAAESVGGELRFGEMSSERGYPGYTFRVDYGEGDTAVRVRNRVYIKDDIYYHLQVFSFAADGGEKSRKRFFDGFRPTAKSAPAATR